MTESFQLQGRAEVTYQKKLYPSSRLGLGRPKLLQATAVRHLRHVLFCPRLPDEFTNQLVLDLRDKPSLQQPVRKLTEARFASDRLPSSSVDSLSSSSRSSETLMASVTTEMLRGGSVSFQPSGAYAQHTACCQTYCEMACTPFHCKTVRFVFQLRTHQHQSHPQP